MFATVRNAQLPPLIPLPLPRPQRDGVDALSYHWEFPRVLYAYLPLPLSTNCSIKHDTYVYISSRPGLLLHGPS